MNNVIQFPRPKLKLDVVSFRDFMRWRYGIHYNGMMREWLHTPYEEKSATKVYSSYQRDTRVP